MKTTGVLLTCPTAVETIRLSLGVLQEEADRTDMSQEFAARKPGTGNSDGSPIDSRLAGEEQGRHCHSESKEGQGAFSFCAGPGLVRALQFLPRSAAQRIALDAGQSWRAATHCKGRLRWMTWQLLPWWTRFGPQDAQSREVMGRRVLHLGGAAKHF